MKNRISLFLTFVSLLALTLMNCGGDDTPHIETLTEVRFLATTSNIIDNRGEANQSDEDDDNVDIPLPTLLKMTIENTAGETVFSDTLSLLRIGTGFQTDAIKLPSGQDYHIVEFLALDENTVLYAAPKEGSDKAQFVGDPLPVTFSLGTNQTLVEVEVLQVESTDDPSDYGYFSVRFDLQTLFYWRTIVFKINNETSELETVLADLTVTLENEAEFTFDLDHGEQRLPILPSDNYELLYEVDGFDPIKVGLSRNELLSHEDSPLVITFANDDNPGGNPNERVFDDIGIHDFTIPNNFLPRKITVELLGAAGSGSNGKTGGDGGYRKIEIPVLPGDSFKLVVGEGGLRTSCQSTNGGGGGGLSGIFTELSNNPNPFATPLAIAAGGGGASYFGNGCHADKNCNTPSPILYGQNAGYGYGGPGLTYSGTNPGPNARGKGAPTFAGGLLDGGSCNNSTQSGGFGGGGAGGAWIPSSNNQHVGGGGGGAGWPGGKGGNPRYHGEGGTSFVRGGLSTVQNTSQHGSKGGFADGGNGKIIISW